jgi:hypothetical protein
MIPAYVLAALFLLVWVVQGFAKPSAIVKRLLGSRLVKGYAIILCLLSLLLAVALPIVLPIFHFPRPSGPYQIGTLTYHWVQASRYEIFSNVTSGALGRRASVLAALHPATALLISGLTVLLFLQGWRLAHVCRKIPAMARRHR